MSDSTDKKELAAKVVDAVHDDLFSREFKRPENMPEDVRDKIIATRKKHMETLRAAYIDLYAKHMNTQQMQALLDFHESGMGKSIKEAMALIFKELGERLEEENSKKASSAVARIAAYNTKKDFFNPED